MKKFNIDLILGLSWGFILLNNIFSYLWSHYGVHYVGVEHYKSITPTISCFQNTCYVLIIIFNLYYIYKKVKEMIDQRKKTA